MSIQMIWRSGCCLLVVFGMLVACLADEDLNNCQSCDPVTQHCKEDKTGCECNPGLNQLPGGTCVDICESCDHDTQQCNKEKTGCECNPWLNQLPDGNCVECSNHGLRNSTTFKCKCTDGYSGDNCETVPCNNHGTWNSDKSNCDCTDGYTGDNCETDICDTCDHDTQHCKEDKTDCECNAGLNQLPNGTCVECNNHGSLNPTTSKCVCTVGYSGDNCETDICESCDHVTQYCNRDKTGCECNPGFNQLPDGTCVECSNHGTWNSTTSKCECTDGYSGVNCEIECNNRGSWNSDKSRCECADGYTGDKCETECNDYGSWNSTTSKCECSPGYSGDKCETECSNHGSWNSTASKCECTDVYSGDNCETECNDHGSLNSTTSICKCADGYSGDNCETDICESCDHATQQCKKDKTGCECNPGLNQLPGGTCVDNCKSCDPVTQQCKEDKTGCECNPGLNQLPGGTCVVPCNNHGTWNSATCKCADGYTGDNCETAPCNNHGTWNSKTSGCDCTDGYTGDNCETAPVEVPDEETDGSASTHFLAYLLVAIVLCIVGYVVYHNRRKLIGLVVEGNEKRSRGSRPSSKDYARLEENVSDTLSKGQGKTYIF